MSRLPSKVWIALLVPLAALAFIGGAYLFFYRGSYRAPPTVRPPVENIVLPPTVVGSFVETPSTRKGVFLLDVAHSNDFDEAELGALLSKVVDRGYTIEFLGMKNHRNFLAPGPEERQALLQEKLLQADSFAIILPQDAYTKEEVGVVERFVQKGGKLLLIGDPSRHHHINTVSKGFGIVFQDGYLYNVIEHDLNFRNIFLRDFLPDDLTQGLKQIAFYTAGSIKSSWVPLVSTDSNTYSSMIERTEPFSPVVKSRDGRVLAIADLTFLIPPQNAVADNSRFIANVAAYLTKSERRFELVDFPYFFRGSVDILVGEAALFDIGTQMKSSLAGSQIQSEVRGTEDLSRDTIFVGLYGDSSAVIQYLEVAGVQVSDVIRTPFTSGISREGTGIVLLYKGAGGRYVLVVLGDTRSTLLQLIGLLRSGQFRSGLVSDILGVYRSF